MSRFSIVIPIDGDDRRQNEIQRFEDTLASVLRSRPRESQIIVVHNGRYEDPHGLGSEVDWIVETSPYLADQLDRSLKAATGDLITLLRPGIELDEGWNESVPKAFENKSVGSLTPLIVSTSYPAKITVGGIWANRSGTRRLAGFQKKFSHRTLRNLKPLGPSSHFGIYRRSVLKAIGPAGSLTEDLYVDVDIALSMRELGFTNALGSDVIGTTESEDLIIAESTRPHGCSAERSLSRYSQADSSSTLSRILWEIAKAPLKPWLFRHGFQRLSAKRHRALDQAFRQHLAAAKNTPSWRDSATESESKTSRRRAA